jgi:uncharacterized protein (DUF433 family)
MFSYAGYFERRSGLCGGALVIKGTRVPVRTLLASLAEGATEAEVLADFPSVTQDGLRAVIAFAAASAEDPIHNGKYSTRFTRSSGSAIRAISSKSATMRPIVRSS